MPAKYFMLCDPIGMMSQLQIIITMEDIPPSLSVLSWNILADTNVSASMYPYATKEHLSYDYRIKLIKDYIHDKSPHVLCLQEVDYSKSFFAFLGEQGYECKYRPKGMQGILIGYKRQLFTLLKEEMVHFDNMLSPKQNKQVYGKGHGMVMLKLEGLGRRFVVTNTHIYWNPKLEKIKYHQVCAAILAMRRFTEPDTPIIFCGDFNSLPNSNTVRLILQNQSPSDENMVEADKNLGQMSQMFKDVSKSLLGFGSVFGDEDGSSNLTSEFKGRIDYVFFRGVEVKWRRPRLELGEEAELPNAEVPSDHIPLLCHFT